jgi:hypothetical protein
MKRTGTTGLSLGGRAIDIRRLMLTLFTAAILHIPAIGKIGVSHSLSLSGLPM